MIELHRHEDWQDRLSAYFAVVEELPFRWGEHDCALFAANAIQRMSGTDIAAAFRGQYNDRITAAKALRDHGAGTLQKTFTALLGSSKHVINAHRGDVVVHHNSMGICCGSFARFVGEFDEMGQPLTTGEELGKRSYLIAVPMALCQRAWTVPY